VSACYQPDFSNLQFSISIDSKSKVTEKEAGFSELPLADPAEILHVSLRPTGHSLESRGLARESKRRHGQGAGDLWEGGWAPGTSVQLGADEGRSCLLCHRCLNQPIL